MQEYTPIITVKYQNVRFFILWNNVTEIKLINTDDEKQYVNHPILFYLEIMKME
jgi:hypothetical protein